MHCPQPAHRSTLNFASLATCSFSKASFIRTGLRWLVQTLRQTPQRIHATVFTFLALTLSCFSSNVAHTHQALPINHIIVMRKSRFAANCTLEQKFSRPYYREPENGLKALFAFNYSLFLSRYILWSNLRF